MLVNSAIYINGREVKSVDDFTAELMDGMIYVWSSGEFNDFRHCLSQWVDMPLDDDMMIPTYEYKNFKFMDDRRK